jgi:protein SCO1/2
VLIVRCVATAALLLALSGPATGTGFRARPFHPTPPAPEIALTASDGSEFRLSQERGHVVVLTFGYTYCPDVCPAILGKLAQARAQLGVPASRVRVVLVTLDPVRDTPDRLRTHLDRFDTTFIGVTGTPEAVTRVQRAYGIVAHRDGAQGSDGFPVNHSAPMYVIDHDGRLRLLFTVATPVTDMAHDLALLSKAAERP